MAQALGKEPATVLSTDAAVVRSSEIIQLRSC